MKNIQKLSQNSSRLLSSSNIITSIFSAVKELVENSIDGGATSIEVKLENCGLDRIEVRDNGCGIEQCDVSCVAKAHYTSKLTSHLDLDQLETYGFRGEALSALCSMASLSITTKTVDDDISQTYSFNKSGDVTASKPSSSPCGTVVIVENLFKDIPVRKKYYKSEKCKKEELKKIEDLLCAYSCAQIGTRFALYHNKSLIWQKSSATNMKAVLIQVFGNSVVSNLEHRTFEFEAEEIKINAHLPKVCAPILSVTRAQCDRSIVIINKRPVLIKAIHKLVQETYYHSVTHDETRNRFPVFLLDITVPLSKLDVNVDPNKTKVLLHNFEIFLSNLSDFLKNCFSKTETGIHVANSALTNNNSEAQLSLSSITETHLKVISSDADLNLPGENNKSHSFEVHKPGLFPSKSLTKNYTNTMNFATDKLSSHSIMPNISGTNSLTYDLVNQMMLKPTTKLQTSCKNDSNTVQNCQAADTRPSISKVSFQKEASVNNEIENDCLIINHINLIRKDGETEKRRPHTGGLFTCNVSSKKLYENSPKLQTTLNMNEETAVLKCQVVDRILPKKNNAENCSSSNLSTDTIEPISKNMLKGGNIENVLIEDCNINRGKHSLPLESNYNSTKTFEQNKQGSFSVSKNVDSLLNSCRKNSMDTNINVSAPNFPQLKKLFMQSVVSKASNVEPHQPVPTIENPNNVNIYEKNIGNLISSCEPPRSAVNSCEPPRSAVNLCEPPRSAVYSCEPPRSAVNSCEPPRSAVNSCVPPRLAVNPCEPLRSAVNPCEPPRSAVSPCEPPRSAVNSCEPPRSAINSCEPPRSAINSCEPPRSAINSCVPPTFTVNSCVPPRSAINSWESPRSVVNPCEPSSSVVNSCERNKNQKPNLQTSGNSWSLGKRLDSTGKTLQPVLVLAPSPTKRSRAPSNESPEGSKKKKISLTKEKAAEIPKNPLSGFEYFCRSTRLGVQVEHPEFNNQEIAQILYQQWKNLPPEKKTIFKELAIKPYGKIVKPKKQLSNVLSQVLNKPKKSAEESNDDSQSKYRKERKEAKLNFDLEDLNTLFSTPAENLSKNDNSGQLTPIKVLSAGVWLCLREENLILLNSYRMKETLIYHRLLNTYQLKPDTLETPLNLNSELVVDPECWQVLMTMYSENTLNHASLTSNGFDLRAIKDDIELSFEVVGIATCVPSYGIHDLQEILHIIKVKGLSLPLAEYRPAKIKHYLQSETVRIGRQSLTIQKGDEFIDLLKQSQKYLPSDTSECFHGKPFQHCIFNISSLLTECNNSLIVQDNFQIKD